MATDKNFIVKHGLEVGGVNIVDSSGILSQSLITSVPSGAVASTQSVGDSSTALATTAYVRGEIDALINSAPGTLNTLDELAAAINDDAAFNTTLTNAVALKAPLASPTFTGNITVGGTVDGVDIAARDAVLTSTTTTANAALPKAGGTMTGNITGNLIGNVTGNASGTALTVTQAAQTAITSVGTLSTLSVAGATTIGASSTRGTLVVTGTSGASPYIALDHTNYTNGRRYSLYSGGSGAGNFDIYDITANLARLTINSTGNVGIGTAGPTALLHVKKDVDSFIMKVENDGNSAGTSGASYADASDGLWVDTRWNTATNTPFKVTSNSGTAPMMIIKGNGNVGIGTAGP